MAAGQDIAPTLFDGVSPGLYRSIGWKGYRQIRDLAGDRPLRLTYDAGDLEIMSPLSKHERSKSLLGRIVEIVTEELDIPMMSAGSTTLDREDLDTGIEPDESFYLGDLDRVRDPDRLDLSVDPPPDLAVEIEITRGILNRLGVYGALGVPEIWRFDGQTLRVLIRDQDGSHGESPSSSAFPMIPMVEVARRLVEVDTRNETAWARSFREWIRLIVSRAS